VRDPRCFSWKRGELSHIEVSLPGGTFDFDNYAYAVYGRLYRALATFSLTPVIYQLRLQAAPIVLQAAPVAEFGGPATQ
jgi:hypothetical protein